MTIGGGLAAGLLIVLVQASGCAPAKSEPPRAETARPGTPAASALRRRQRSRRRPNRRPGRRNRPSQSSRRRLLHPGPHRRLHRDRAPASRPRPRRSRPRSSTWPPSRTACAAPARSVCSPSWRSRTRSTTFWSDSARSTRGTAGRSQGFARATTSWFSRSCRFFKIGTRRSLETSSRRAKRCGIFWPIRSSSRLSA